MRSIKPVTAPRTSLLLLVLGGTMSLAGCSPGPETADRVSLGGWREIGAVRGIRFHVDRAEFRSFYMPESMGCGCALFDYDQDGDLDVYVVNGFRNKEGSLDPERGSNRLWRQEADGTFTDVSHESGLDDGGYGMGVAVGDYDGDGDLDVYVTNVGQDVLYRNEGNGRFTDVTAAAGLSNALWAASAGWFDADGDGDLDLFVTNYVDYDAARHVGRDGAGRPEYPGPETLDGLPDRLFLNQGDGSFKDASATSGIGARPGKGLGVAFLDLDGDGLVDIYVANDREANFAWINQGSGRFEERAMRMNLAYNELGKPEASMGIAVGDVDGDGLLDILLTHIVTETHTLYRCRKPGLYEDVTSASGLGATTLSRTGWGAVFLDVDNDGGLDLAVVNGRVLRGPVPEGARLSDHWNGYAEQAQVFLNRGTGTFAEASDVMADFTATWEVGRGLAVGDVDRDGAADLLVSTADGRVRLLRNEVPKRGHWLMVRLDPKDGSADAIGARLDLVAGGRSQVRVISRAGSYLSSSDAVAHFGLGAAPGVERLVVTWADGDREVFGPFDADRSLTLERGRGRPLVKEGR